MANRDHVDAEQADVTYRCCGAPCARYPAVNACQSADMTRTSGDPTTSKSSYRRVNSGYCKTCRAFTQSRNLSLV